MATKLIADQRQRHRLEQRDVERGRRRRVGGVVQEQAGGQAEDRLQQVLPARLHAVRVALDDLDPVVVPADRAERDHHRQHQPHVAVAQVAPQQHRGEHGEQDQRAAHGRRAGLGEVRLRAVLADRLAALERGQPADHRRAPPQRQRQRGQRAEDAAEGEVAEQPEQALQLLQPAGEFKQHAAFPPRCAQQRGDDRDPSRCRASP